MNSGTAVATDESKAQFIEELCVYVQDRKDNPPSGNLLPGKPYFYLLILFYIFGSYLPFINAIYRGLTQLVAPN